MIQVALTTTIEAPWTDLPPLRLGEVSAGRGIPAIYVSIEEEDVPTQRIDVYISTSECQAFQEAIVWQSFVVIGFGEQVYLVARDSREIWAYPQEGYFGHLYPTEDHLFVASAERLACIDSAGTLVWRTESLGIDGVIVDDVREGVVYGQGEWDPPGGWKPFQVDAGTGKRLAI